MRFSWTGLILAPLLVPLMFCAVMLSFQTNGSVLLFLILLVPSWVVSYGTTIFLFLLLGAVVFVPLTLLEWKSSGPDSGPPTESFWVFFLRWAADPMTAIYPTGQRVQINAGLRCGMHLPFRPLKNVLRCQIGGKIARHPSPAVSKFNWKASCRDV
jgi:hypothetical protein